MVTAVVGYDKRELPNKGEMTIARVGFYIHDMCDVSETTMDYSVDCFFRISWTDLRLHVRNLLNRLELVQKLGHFEVGTEPSMFSKFHKVWRKTIGLTSLWEIMKPIILKEAGRWA